MTTRTYPIHLYNEDDHHQTERFTIDVICYAAVNATLKIYTNYESDEGTSDSEAFTVEAITPEHLRYLAKMLTFAAKFQEMMSTE